MIITFSDIRYISTILLVIGFIGWNISYTDIFMYMFFIGLFGIISLLLVGVGWYNIIHPKNNYN